MAWEIESETPSYRPIIDKYAKMANIDPTLIEKIMMAESGGNPMAVSPKGAKGAMQIMPKTAQDLGLKNPLNLEENIKAGVNYFSQLHGQFGGDTRKALAAYNWGSENVKKDPELKTAPKETHDYINKIMGNPNNEWEVVDEVPSQGWEPVFSTPTEPVDDVPEWGAKHPNLYGAAGATYETLAPVAEALGFVGGGIAGTASGLITGPFAPLGTVVGSGLGYAGVKEIEKPVRRMLGLPEEKSSTIGNFKTGAMMEMGGQSLGKGLGWVGDKLKGLWKPDISTKAVNIIKSAEGEAPAYSVNAKEASLIEQEIPGFKSSMGEARNDPGLIKLQRSLERKPGEAADIYLQRKAENLNAIKDYLSKKFPGNQGINEVIGQITKRTGELETAAKTAIDKSQAVIEKLKPVEPQATGQNIREAIEQTRLPVKNSVEAQYNAIPNEPLKTQNTSATIKALEKDFRPGEEAVYPSSVISRVKKAIEPKTETSSLIDYKSGKPTTTVTEPNVGFQDLHSLRKDIGRQIHTAITGGNPNYTLAMRLEKIKGAIDADIEAGMGTNNAYTSAKKAYVEYCQRFRSGAVGTVRQRGTQITGLKTPEAMVGKKFATLDGADDLNRAIGKDRASIIMEGYFADDLMGKLPGLSPTRLKAWINTNGKVLDKYGLRSEFENLSKAQQTVEAAKNLQVQYGKSVAAKLLNADPGRAIEVAMAGGEGVGAKNTGEIMRRLMKQVESNPDAVIGLQNSFKDFMVKSAEKTAKTITDGKIIGNASFQKLMDKYKPAMEVLYAKDPKKLVALKNVQKAIEIQTRSSSSPLGGGSDTTENLTSGVALETVGRIVGHVSRTANIGIALAKKGLGLINSLNEKEINNLVYRAMVDPELAETLMFARSNIAPKIVEQRFAKSVASVYLATKAFSPDTTE